MQVAGVAGRKTQATMRHSSRALTDDVYTDEESLEVAEAVEMAMPSMPLIRVEMDEEQTKKYIEQSANYVRTLGAFD